VPKLVYSSETVGCGATIQLDSNDICMISVAQAGVLVRHYRPGVWNRLVGSLFGAKLFNETNVYQAAKTAMALSEQFPNPPQNLMFKNVVLSAFANAVWHCSSSAEVAILLNEVAAQTIKDTGYGPLPKN
jgi:hypothetical protein